MTFKENGDITILQRRHLLRVLSELIFTERYANPREPSIATLTVSRRGNSLTWTLVQTWENGSMSSRETTLQLPEKNSTPTTSKGAPGPTIPKKRTKKKKI